MIRFRRPKPDVPGRRSSRPASERSGIDDGAQFRRNRTLSGVRRADEPTPSARAQVHHLANRRRKVGGIFLIVLLAILLLTVVITQFTAKVIITTAAEVPSASIDASRYEKAINDYLGIHPAGRFRFALDETDMSTYVASVTPEVASVSQSGSQNVVETRFAVSFREPVAGWQINGRQYYVDTEGVVFEKNYYGAPTLQIIDESGISPEQGSTVASVRLLSFVGRVVALSRAGGYEVTDAVLPTGTTREIDIHLKNVRPRIKLSIDRGAGEQVEDMIRSLRYLESRGAKPSYIDVRISGRAVYR